MKYIFTLLLSLASVILVNSAENDYQESINIHLGRKTYISGELLMYKLFCTTAAENNFLSKVAYVELVDAKGESVIQQTLNIEGNAASSIMQIPDTLHTGAYTLTAYTLWMRNFGRESFFQEPVFIYNQYDETAAYSLTNYSVPFKPNIFIEGGALIENVTNKLIIQVPGLFGKELNGFIGTSESDSLGQSFSINEEGFALLDFKPIGSQVYKLILGDDYSGRKIFNMPSATQTGYKLHVHSLQDQVFSVSYEKYNVINENLTLVARSKGNNIGSIAVGEESQVRLSVILPKEREITIQLTNSNGNILAQQLIILDNTEVIATIDKDLYNTRDQIGVNIKTNEFTGSKLSVTVYKKEINAENLLNSSEVFVNTHHAYLKMPNMLGVFEKFTDENKSKSSTSTSCVGMFPVEDMGIILTGKVKNSATGEPASEVEVILAIQDTIANILSGRTDSQGCFALLINQYGNKKGNIVVNQPDQSNYQIFLDDKSDFNKKTNYSSLSFSNDPELITFLKNESQRVLIQRAFPSDNNIQGPIVDKRQAFYGEPLITVFPAKYIILPNFEEISRELLPRVKYKKTKSGCEAFVMDIENGIKSEIPVFLLDGVPVRTNCDLYPLSSEDIQRIEIQSGNRISGNLLYNGLVSVFTSSKYKTKKAIDDERIIFNIPGFSNISSAFSIPQVTADKAPDFKNQLYWNPDLIVTGEGTAEFKFYSTNEDGEYIIDIRGYSNDGYPVSFQHTFTISDL